MYVCMEVLELIYMPYLICIHKHNTLVLLILIWHMLLAWSNDIPAKQLVSILILNSSSPSVWLDYSIIFNIPYSLTHLNLLTSDTGKKTIKKEQAHNNNTSNQLHTNTNIHCYINIY